MEEEKDIVYADSGDYYWPPNMICLKRQKVTTAPEEKQETTEEIVRVSSLNKPNQN